MIMKRIQGPALGAGRASRLDASSLRSPHAAASVSRLMHLGETVGTAVRISLTADRQGDLILVGRHCVEKEGACLSGLSAFGSELTFVAARADLDVAVFRGPRGPGLALLQRPLQQGAQLGMLSFPLGSTRSEPGAAASQTEGAVAGAAAAGEQQPVVDEGLLSKICASGLTGVAFITTGMPNSSGGAMLSDPDVLAGIYTGIVWHLQEPDGTSSHTAPDDDSSRAGHSTGSGRSSGGGGSEAPSELERDPNAMWTPSDDAGAGAVAAAAVDVEKAAELSLLSSGHKTCMSVFTTAPALWQLLQGARVARLDPEQLAARCVRPKRRRA